MLFPVTPRVADWLRGGRQVTSKDRLSAGYSDGRTRYVARQRIGQPYVCGRNLGWLTGRFIGTCLLATASSASGRLNNAAAVARLLYVAGLSSA